MVYRSSVAQSKAELVAERPKKAKLVANPEPRIRSGPTIRPDKSLRQYGSSRAWSHEQIAARLKSDFPDDEPMRISHETIYQALYIQGRGALKRELILWLRTGRVLRAPRARARRKVWTHVTPEALISERPAEAEDRAVPGHWEGDLLIALELSAIGTLVERTTRFTMLAHLPREDGYRHGHSYVSRAELIPD